MNDFILPLCIAIAAVVAVVLVMEGLRIRSGMRRVKEAEARLEDTTHTLKIRQGDRLVQIRYCSQDAECVQIPSAEEVIETEEVPDSPPTLIPQAEKLNFEQKFERLSDERKQLLDEFSAYFCAQKDCTRQEQANAVAFKYKKSSVAKAVIRRECVLLYFTVVNPELGRMVREEKLRNLKVKPVEIRLKDRDDLSGAIRTANITVGYLQKEEEYRMERRKEKRRMQRGRNEDKEVIGQ